jgi:hypothetical protein
MEVHARVARRLPFSKDIAAKRAPCGRTGRHDKVSTTRFVCYGVVSALIWAGGGTGRGYLLSQAVTETAARLGIRLTVFFLATSALYPLFHRAHSFLARRVVNGGRALTGLAPVS